MARIVVLGGTGYAGRHLVEEAVARAHDVLAVSRRAATDPVDGATYRTGDVRDEAVLAKLLDGADVVVSALSPRGDMADRELFRSLESTLARLAQDNGVRLGVIGGAGSLLVAEGGPKLMDTPEFPAEFAEEPRILDAVLQDLLAADETLDWFFVSPAGGFGDFAPGEARGTYRLGGDVLLTDDEGASYISAQDLALAILDEIDRPAHRRSRFTVAY
ncbi:NAD-dependent epimerase [Brachybacterium sp. P6-10-X1]|uniref:NAD(P)-dependent oxidoreductase n=1 Tax=Brachybacterium sp. P6-10-X1 TaxID=1903186 RepID=UPI000971A864|nr:NAD(P)H-binding protein [Brachybacterium sp. P6-10-X1]APX32659.1 NAD-dependent epimerase [Brachybacterium sp. P6-10-X1]